MLSHVPEPKKPEMPLRRPKAFSNALTTTRLTWTPVAQ
jgi:hypothetical protein